MSCMMLTTASLCLAGLLALNAGMDGPVAPPAGGTPAAPPAGTPATKAPAAGEPDWKTLSIWTLETKTLEGQPANLSAYAGKVALVVNVASQCGLTPQYAGLEALAAEFKDKGLVVLGFPCNDFGGQEPGTAKEIRDFCTANYKVSFPLFAKVSVKPGEQQAPLFKALEARTGKTPRWNFGKYLVSRDGVRTQFFDSKVTPDARELREAIEKALAEPAPAR